MAYRLLKDLIPIHAPDHPQNDPAIAALTDDELLKAIFSPHDGNMVKVKGNRVFDGNTRINEAKSRSFDPELEIPVEELLEVDE